MTGVTTIGVAWVVGRADASTIEKDSDTPIAAPQYSFTGGITALMFVLLILVGYAVVALKWEAFVDYDDSFFTLVTLRGHNYGPPIWPGLGRFFPLGQQEFNLIRHFTSSVMGYHAVPICQLLTISCLLFFLDDELSITVRLVLTAICLLTPSLVVSFTGLVFSDRNVVFWLSCLMFFVRRFEKTQSTALAVAAALSAQAMIYYKETAFLLLLGFAVGHLILRCWRADQAGWDYGLLRTRGSVLDICFICVGVMYLLNYLSVMIHKPNIQYAQRYGVPWDRAALYYLRLDLLGLVFVIVALRRACLIFQRKSTPSPFWDGLAIGGVACYAAYFYLRLCKPYYLAPVDFIAVLYIGRLVVLSWGGMLLWRKWAISATVSAVLLQSVSLSAFYVYERENMIHAKAQLADAILARSSTHRSDVQRLFFPFSSTYLITEFASYLVYRGLRLEGYETTTESLATSRFVIVSGTFTKDGNCVEYRDFICHAGSKPDPGDLVIELPDDLQSLAEMNPYRTEGEPLFTYEPRPRLQRWMYRLLDRLVASARWPFTDLPDRWLHSSMTLWR